ncbi:helix-turn-helix transcriptional regulator [Klebsiella aerogenes]|uniref:helix-turn-helix transcriptional regulator n=1 Tax=Klebsiella aerogenes TaxID=548 RepID=UPI002D7FD547|nr:LuxR C-terminal-related transcriptional regulator [Klebsiella aerogenes]
MKVIINSKDIWFRLGVEYCLQQIASDYNGNYYAELGYCNQSIREADMIILPLHGYQDYKHIYALSQFYQGIILGVSTSRNVHSRRLLFSQNILWISSRETIENVHKLLLTIKHRQLYHHDGQPDFSVMKTKAGVPLSEREMMIIDHVAAGTPVNAIARALGLRVKTIYAHLDKIKANFNLKGGSHFHRFMIRPPSCHLL